MILKNQPRLGEMTEDTIRKNHPLMLGPKIEQTPEDRIGIKHDKIQ